MRKNVINPSVSMGPNRQRVRHDLNDTEDSAPANRDEERQSRL